MNDNEQSKREELEKQKNQLLNDLINVNNQLEKGNNKSTIISIIFFSIPFLTFLLGILFIIDSSTYSKSCNKDTIKRTLSLVIKNDGTLSNIKHLYNSRELEDVFFLGLRPKTKSKYYDENTSLSYILNDLLSDYYINKDSVSDSVYFHNLNAIIIENEKRNPFDNLEDNQKYNFENIQVKLDSNYVSIHSDVTKIADELNSKNQLVNKYLNKSEISFYISLLALFITILLSSYQIYQSYSSNKSTKKFLSSITNKKEDE